MGDVSDQGPTTESRLLSIDRYPDPVVGFRSAEGQPTITATNRAFEISLGTVAVGRSVSALIDGFGITTGAGNESLAECLLAETRTNVHVETDSGEYLACVLPPTDGEDGYVLFVDDLAGDGATSAAGAQPGARGAEDPNADDGNRQGQDRSSGDLSIDRVASVLSHDLRNPLDVAKAQLRAGRERGEGDHLEQVAAAHDRMERIIEDVLTLSRGEEYIDPDESVDLSAVAESAWRTVETAAATLTVEDGLPTTTADRDRAERLFENLFRNAVEHGEEPHIVVGPLEDAGAGFYVADDGPGIPPDERSVVFEPGYSTHDHGTGLGLSIVERIAAAHGWRVAAVGVAEGGARIEVRDGESEPES